jgi:putative flippase GtrA
MKQFSRFLLVGITNTGLGFAVIFACMYLGRLTAELSNAVGYLVGLVASYLLNRHFTFRSASRPSTELIRITFVFLFAYIVNLIVLIVLLRELEINALLSQVLAAAAYIGMVYVLNKNYVFYSIKAG